MIILRGYQTDCVARIRDAFRRGRKSVALVAPTGSGKTRIMVYIAHGAVAKSNRIVILVHRQELVRQTAAALQEMGVEFGLIAAGHLSRPELPVQLAMVQTLARRADALPPTMLIIDEFHHGVSETYAEIIARWPTAKILGLTATPQRLDGKGLSAICEELVVGPSVQELIDAGFLARPIYYAPPGGPDMTGVRKTAGDFNKGQTAALVDRREIIGSAVEHYRRICGAVPAVAFCASVEHAKHVRDQFNEAGIPAATIDGTLGEDERIDRVAALGEGRIKVLTSVDVISEGFDLPCVSAAILLRPTDSLALHLQQVGRALRPKADGSAAIILDHVGNCLRHGLAEEARTWTLAGQVGKKKGAKDAALTCCPQCHTLHKAAPACPTCQHVYPVKEREVAEVDGTLAQLTAAAVLVERDRIKKRQEIGMAKDRAALEAIAKARGYKPGWVTYMLVSRQKNKARHPIGQNFTIQAMKGERAS